jgi:eukaryotic-like serine/threonine-protein kinase
MKNALVVGIDNYSTSPLSGCVNDAQRIAEILARSSSAFTVRTLIDGAATRSKVRREIEWCLSEATYSLIYFAGHGVRTNVATLLATHDYEEGDEGVDFSWLQSAVARLSTHGQTCAIVLDCCHSGDATVRALSSMKFARAMDLHVVGGAGKVLLAACKGDEEADEDVAAGKSVGLFTTNFCDALEGFAADDNGVVTVNAAYDYVASKLHELGAQTPVFKGDLEGRIALAIGVQKKGNWTPKSGAAPLTPQEATAQAESLLSSVLHLTAPRSHSDWQGRGYREACQVFEPILGWFLRRMDTQPELRANPGFREKYESCLQTFKSLGNVMPGMQMPQGTVGTTLGSGTFGTVLRMASDATPPICVKIYHAHDLFDMQKVGRFRRGYSAMKQLDHPQIVKVREMSEVPFGFFMDYVDGANSRQYNPGSVQDPEVVVDLLLEVAETLQHAHGRGVIHRDVKPENILIKIDVSGVPSAFLTDFDLSWFSAATQVTKLAEGFGSHFYAAPEQINSPNASVAHKASVDAYSFGQLCFFFVCGRDPLAFNTEGNAKALEQELGRKWPDSTAAQEMLPLSRLHATIA